MRIAIGRASDFFGPCVTESTLGERVFANALSGKRADFLGNPDLLHTYSYVPDIAAGLATLGTDGQGLDQLTLTLAKILPATSRSTGDQFWLTQTRTVHTETASAYGVVTVSDTDDPVQRINGGRLTERLHLAATTHGLAMQYMNQITERIDRERTSGNAATFDARLDALLAQPGRLPLVTFRIGYPVRAARRSPRRPLTEVAR